MLKRRLRSVLVSVTLAALSLGYAARSAWAVAGEAGLSASRVMMNLPAAWLHGGTRRVILNGAAIEIMSGRADDSLPVLLDHAEGACRQHAGGVSSEVARVLARPGHAEPSVLRFENEREGLVACLDLGGEHLSAEELRARLERFARELDLAELGGVRLLRAQALEHGSFFVLAASDGAVPIARMFPALGDAPGVDPSHAPRPSRARRVLSAFESHASQSVVAYEVERPVDVLWSDYLLALASAGYLPAQPDLAQSGAAPLGLFQRGGQSLVVLAEPTEGGSRLVISSL